MNTWKSLLLGAGIGFMCAGCSAPKEDPSETETPSAPTASADAPPWIPAPPRTPTPLPEQWTPGRLSAAPSPPVASKVDLSTDPALAGEQTSLPTFEDPSALGLTPDAPFNNTTEAQGSPYAPRASAEYQEPASAEPQNPLREPGAPPSGVRPEPTFSTPAPQGPAEDRAAEKPPEAPPDASAESRPDAATKKPPRKGNNSDVPFDPIKENGRIFVDWPKPTLTLLFTGQIHGYLEPCGCAGLDSMKGGMARRHTLFRQLRDKGWPVIGLDVGNLAHGFGRQAEIKFHTLIDATRKMGYSTLTLGVNELKLPTGDVVSRAVDCENQQRLFVSANVGIFGLDSGFTAFYRVLEAGGRKIGVTSVLGKSVRREVNNTEVEIIDPEVALKKILPELKQKSDYRILLAHATMEESIELGKKFPEFDVVVTSGGPPEPPGRPKTLNDGKTLLIEVGEKGMNAIVLALFDDPQTPWRYQRVPIDSRFAASPAMQTLMMAYQEQLKLLGFEGLGLLRRPVPHPQKQSNGRFVGSAKCESCHDVSYRIWKKSKHAKAYQTLEDLDPPRNFDPECVSCHVVGWNPTQFFPYEGSYVGKQKTPHLIDTGCETCHGPGELHCLAEDGTDEARQELYRKAVRITKEESQKGQCATCHDLDNSPDFDFKTYWPDMEHYEDEDD